MIRALTVAFVLFCLSIAEQANASRQDTLTITSFQLETDVGGLIGQVFVDGQRDQEGQIETLNIRFYDVSVDVPKVVMLEIPHTANIVQISGETGYDITGGTTGFVTFMNGPRYHAPTCENMWIVIVQEHTDPTLYSSCFYE